MRKSRRKFLWFLNSGLVLLFLGVWNKLTLERIRSLEKEGSILPFNQNQTVSFHDRYIVIHQDKSIKVFSSKCTHLGCKISQVEQGRLICPCHGSTYNLEGKPETGPAFKSLEPVRFKLSGDQKTIEIQQ